MPYLPASSRPASSAVTIVMRSARQPADVTQDQRQDALADAAEADEDQAAREMRVDRVLAHDSAIRYLGIKARMYRKSTSTWRYPLGLLAAYGIVWLALAIDPVFRQDWLLENAIVFVAIPLLVLTARRLRFSDFAYTLPLRVLRACTRSARTTPTRSCRTPIGGSRSAARALEGRNHYDRLVHFVYGLLVTPAAVELFAHYGRYSRSWAFLFPWMFMAGHAVLYELIEFAAAIAVRRRSRPGLSRDAGRHLGRAEGHGARARRHHDHARGARARPGRLPVRRGVGQSAWKGNGAGRPQRWRARSLGNGAAPEFALGARHRAAGGRFRPATRPRTLRFLVRIVHGG